MFKVYLYAHYQVLALPQACTKKARDVSKGGGGGLQKNVYLTFLVDKIDM